VVRYSFTVRLFHSLHLAGFPGARCPILCRERGFGFALGAKGGPFTDLDPTR
jgi:hypothetical protein